MGNNPTKGNEGAPGAPQKNGSSITFTPTPPNSKKPVTNPRNGQQNTSKVQFQRCESEMTNDSFGEFELKEGQLYTAKDRRHLCQKIFAPPQGHLEVLHGGFISREVYIFCGFIVGAFAGFKHREKWFLDTPTIAYLGERLDEVDVNSLKGNISKARTNDLIRRRNELTAALREHLLIITGAAKEGKRAHQTLGTVLHLIRGRGGSMESDTTNYSFSDSAISPPQTPNPRSRRRSQIAMDRLESRFSDSFACLQTLAGAVKELVPANTLDRYRTLFDYVHPREPIVNKALSIDSLQDNSTRYDLEEDNYFVSLGDRAKLMKCPDSTLNSGSELYSAMRNMNLVITTACSSLVIYVMDNLANAINLRNRYKQHVAEAQSTKNMSYEEIVNELGGVKQFLGVAGDDIEEWFRFVLTEEMSLTYFTRLLIKKHRKQMEKSYKSIAIGVMGAKLLDKLSDTPSDEFDYLQVICSIYFKIVFVVAGGKRSIRSDDMRFNVNPHDINNDVWLSRMVESPILSRICWIPYMLGMPLMASKSNLYSLKSKPLGFDEASEASGILREVFQAVGALPMGDSCPLKYVDWFSMFPFHAVNVEGKRVLMSLYTSLHSPPLNVPLSFTGSNVLETVAAELEKYPELKKQPQNCFFQSREQMEKMKRKQEKLDRKVEHQLEESSRSMMSISPSKRTMQYSGYDYGSFDDDHNNDSMMSGGSSMSSISTLFDAEAPVDIYTCINPQSQLYLRCANELTTRRQRQTLITPYVQAQYFTSLATLKSKRTELRVVVDRALNGLKNDEAVLVVKWTAAPVVRFSISDIINIVPEHGSSSNMSRTFSNSESDVMNGMVISPEQEERAQNSYPVRTNDKSSRTSCWAIKQILAVPAASINRGNANLDDEEMVPSPNGKVNDIFILVLKFTGGSFIDEKSKVSNIGHQHAAQNAFNYLDGNVTWSNPVMALTMKEEHDAIVTGKKVSKERKITLKNGAGSPDLKISETEDMVRKAFFAFGVLLGNTITNGVFFAVPVAPILFYIFKLVHETRDMRMQSLAFFQAYEGNLLSATHLQRRADEILAMTDDRYYNFLKSKNLVKPEALPFRPIESAAEEANTCMKNASQSGTHSPNSHSGYKDNSTPRFLDAYRDAIRDRNQKGLWFDGPPTVPVYARGSSTAHKTSSLPPIDKRGSVASSVLNAEETAALAQLPSRQEYVTLYLVNEILWGAVDRGGVGTINLQMWASLVRGFKNSLLCDSPLISLCSARIIREVLCVPN